MIQGKYKKAEWLVAALGAAAVLGLFGWWLMQSHPGKPGVFAAAASAGLFLALGLRFVPVFTAFWTGVDEPVPAGAEPRYMPLRIFAAVLVWDALVLVLAWLLRRAQGVQGGFAATLDFWRCLDSGHYLAIADDWYLSEGERSRLVQLVFLPGYPLLIRLGRLVTGDTLTAGLLVSSLCFAGAACVFYRLVRLDHPYAVALRCVVLLCLWPGSFFFAAPMSESPFLLLCLGCLLLARRGHFLLAALCGAYAAFTRSLGLTLIVPLVMELFHSGFRWRKALPIALVPLGFAAYLLVNVQVAGKAFQFLVYQSEHWGQRLGFFWNTASYQFAYAVDTFVSKPKNFWGLWLPNLIYHFASLALVAAAAKKLRASYTAWFIAYYVIAIGATWLLSAPRYLMAMPVLPMALGALTEKESAKTGAVVTLTLLWTLYFLAFLLRWQVW